jgi:hypothetical protein
MPITQFLFCQTSTQSAEVQEYRPLRPQVQPLLLKLPQLLNWHQVLQGLAQQLITLQFKQSILRVLQELLQKS